MSGNRKHYFPMFVDLTDKKVVVAGAGTIAKRRIRTLVKFTDELIVVAPEVNQELKQMQQEGKLTILKKHFEREDIYDAALVIAATNDNKVNQEIYTACKCLGIPVNVCADKTRCDFYFPGIAENEGFCSRNQYKRKRTEKNAGYFRERYRICLHRKSKKQACRSF